MKMLSYRQIDSNVLRHLFFVIVIIALGYLEFRIIWFIQKYVIETVINETLSPLTGNAFWRAHQNRLLAGYLMQSISGTFGLEHLFTFQWLGIVITSLTNVMAYVLFYSQLRSAKEAFRYVLYFALLVLLFQHSGYLYAWDLFDLLFFVLFGIGIVQQRGGIYFTALFAVAILNRESALFMPVWMGIDALFRTTNAKRNIGKALYALGLLAAGIVLVIYLRETLFLGSHMSQIGMDESHRIVGNHFYLRDNINVLFRGPSVIDIVDHPVLPMLGFFFWMLWKNGRPVSVEQMKLVLLILTIMTTLFLFALIQETRVWLMLIPLILIYDRSFHLHLNNET
jgi:hypothetical protein